MTEAQQLLHKLWTKAVGTKGYDKKEWQQLEAILLDFEYETDNRCIECGLEDGHRQNCWQNKENES
jgi:hypothetical protein